MSELAVASPERLEPIHRYAGFLRLTADNWLEAKAWAGVTHSQPGALVAYETTAQALTGLATDAGLLDAARRPFIAGTTLLLRFQHILALKSRELGYDKAAASRLAHNHRAYTNLARIAAQPNRIAFSIERSVALIHGLNPEEPAFWNRYAADIDRSGMPTVDIEGLGEQIHEMRADEDIMYDIETDMLRRDRTSVGCDALLAHQLGPINDALADIVVTDPDLLAATLTPPVQ